jgi:hypothetical protein
LKYTNLVNEDYRTYREADFLVHDKSAKRHYSEGFSDGMVRVCWELRNSMSSEEILGIIRKLDSKGESFAYEFFSEDMDL